MEQQRKILIAEDEEYHRALLTSYLEQLGFMVKTAVNGQEALEIYGTDLPDIILSDLYMPEMDGFALIKAVVEYDHQIPIIVISGAGLVEDVLRALTTGAWDYITKPIMDLNLLKHSITKALERRDHLIMAGKYRKLLEAVRDEQTGGQKDSVILQEQLKKQIITAKKEWEKTVDVLDDLIGLYDTEHKIVRLNRALAQKLNIPIDAAIGKRLCLFEHRDFVSQQCGCLHDKMMRTGKRIIEQITDRSGTI